GRRSKRRPSAPAEDAGDGGYVSDDHRPAAGGGRERARARRGHGAFRFRTRAAGERRGEPAERAARGAGSVTRRRAGGIVAPRAVPGAGGARRSARRGRTGGRDGLTAL